jgi:hypothetical protein
VFKVRGVKSGTAILSAGASGRAASGTVHGSGQTELNVTGSEIVVNTTSDRLPDPAAFDEKPPRCAVDAKARNPECSLRAAIELANKLGGKQSISFDIPGGGVPQIEPGFPLPPVTASVTIDGTTQRGGWVELSGPKAGNSNGLELEGADSTVRGLVINGFAKGAGILIARGTGDLIAGDRIGSGPAGEIAVPNEFGIAVDAPGVTIGGTVGTKPDSCAGDCDLVSGNAVGEVWFRTGGSGTVTGDTIGPDLTGEKVLKWLDSFAAVVECGGSSGHFNGLSVAGGNDHQNCGSLIVGGATTAPGVAPGNVIAGGRKGVHFGEEASGDVVAGNLIGLDRTGTRSLEGQLKTPSDHFSKDVLSHTDLRHNYAGVSASASTVVVGGAAAADANVISGFPTGVYSTSGILVEHDLIGTNAVGTAAVGNIEGVSGHYGGARVVDSVVSGNLGSGLYDISSVTGSRIGTNSDGTAALPNGYGVTGRTDVGGVRPAGSTSCTGPCNLISGNRKGAVQGADSVEGNFIGTNLAGTSAIPNGNYWMTAQGRAEIATEGWQAQQGAASEIKHLGGPSRAVSGICDRACNLISGNDQPGVQFVSGINPSMEGNVIGRSVAGTPLPNHGAGVLITHARGRGIIGGDGDSGNLIADNLGTAISLVNDSTGALSRLTAPTIEGNAITGNTGGIEYVHGTDSPARPAIPQVTLGTGGQVTVTGHVAGFHSGTFFVARIDIYADLSCEPGPQGNVPLGTVEAGRLSGDWTFTASGIASSLKYFMVTLTIDGSTSPFSGCAH